MSIIEIDFFKKIEMNVFDHFKVVILVQLNQSNLFPS